MDLDHFAERDVRIDIVKVKYTDECPVLTIYFIVALIDLVCEQQHYLIALFARNHATFDEFWSTFAFLFDSVAQVLT